MTITKATFTSSEWQESKVCEAGGHSLANMQDRYHYTGELSGASGSVGVICYLGDTGAFTGYELFTGTLAGYEGTFALRSNGGFAPDAVFAELEVVPGSGTAQLRGLTGSGKMRFEMGAEHGTIELDWKLEA